METFTSSLSLVCLLTAFSMFVSCILASGRRKPFFLCNVYFKKKKQQQTKTREVIKAHILTFHPKEGGGWKRSIIFPPPGDAVWLEVALCSAGFIRALHCFPARPLASLLQPALEEQLLSPAAGPSFLCQDGSCSSQELSSLRFAGQENNIHGDKAVNRTAGLHSPCTPIGAPSEDTFLCWKLNFLQSCSVSEQQIYNVILERNSFLDTFELAKSS